MVVGQDCPLTRGDLLAVRFATRGGNHLEIPAKVVYTAVSATECAVGVKLHLELAPSATRQAFARWIVAMISRPDSADNIPFL
jgi:hypothetical protein